MSAADNRIGEIGAMFEGASLIAVDALEDSLALAERTNSTLKSLISFGGDAARRQAREADQRRARGMSFGRLDGVPYVAKDNFQTRNMVTTGGSRVLEGWQPTEDARAIQLLEAAGAVLVGKSNLHEFAYGATGENSWSGTTVNPHDHNRLAGGSSSGSGAAVAAGIVPFALGTDTGGSIRVPAALCGVVGYKPTLHSISSKGVIPFSWSLDHVGILGNCVTDVATVADCLSERVCEQIEAPGFDGVRVGIVPGWVQQAEPAVKYGFERAASTLKGLGAVIEDVKLTDSSEARTVSLTIQLAEALNYFSPYLRESLDLFGADIRSGFVLGQQLSAESYVQCQRLLAVYRRGFESLLSRVDLLLTPSCPIVAPLRGTTHVSINGERMPVGNVLTLFTSFFNVVGAPCISIPAGFDAQGLPVGVQLVGRPHDDRNLFGFARALERSGFAKR